MDATVVTFFAAYEYHSKTKFLEIGDKVIFIFRGCKSWEGSREEILKTDNEALNKFVFATNMAKKIKKP